MKEDNPGSEAALRPPESDRRVDTAYRSPSFIESRAARPVRILSEYLHPASRFEAMKISDTIVFWGSARTLSREQAEERLEAARRFDGDVAAAEQALAMSRYYEECRSLARRLTEWSKSLEDKRARFVVCTGGGPGIMEAANRGASEARGLNIGLTIGLEHEHRGNPWITRQLEFQFRYFFMRKFWFVYLAKALIAFPGGFGTMDEFFELMCLLQTGKLRKKMPVVLYGSEFWDTVLNLEAMVKFGMVDAADLSLVLKTDTVDEAFDFIVNELTDKALASPGGHL